MTACPDRETLKLLLADSSEGECRRTIAWHVEDCPSCQSALAELAAAAPQVPSTPRTEPLAPLDTGGGVGTPAAGIVMPAVPGYEVGAELGRGGMGLVLRGRDLSLNREVALKLLLPQYQDAPELARRFVEEARVCSQLQHPGIPPIHELGTLPDGRPFFAMKLVKGTTLARLLAERRDPAQELPHFVGVFGQVCQALAYAHSKGVIHRDVKPANVMVGAFGEVQVMDWGLAKILQPGTARPVAEERTAGSVIETVRTADAEVTQVGVVLGTYAYMPPEQARGEIGRLDPRCDVFGLGALLCEILTGQPPYAGTSEEIRVLAQLGHLPDALARLGDCAADAELRELASICLKPRPEDRPADAGAVAAAVMDYQEKVQQRLRQAELKRVRAASRAEHEAAKARAERRARHVTVGLAGALVLLVCLGAGAALWSWHHRVAIDRMVDGERQRIEDLEWAVDGDLEQAVALQKQAEWAEAREALQRASARLEPASPRELRDRLDRARADLAFVSRLDEIRLRAAQGTLKTDSERVQSDYAAAFRQHGLEVGKADAAALARRIQDSPIREQLRDALDTWLIFFPPERSQLLAVLRGVDPNPLRTPLREAISRLDRPKMNELLRQPDLEQLTPPLLLAATWLLRGFGDRGMELLLQAQPRYPSDFWVAQTLAREYNRSGKHPDEAVGWFRAALALRPDSAEDQDSLGVLLLERATRRDIEGAIRCFQAAVKFDPGRANHHYHLGNALTAKRRDAEAAEAYRKAIGLDPKHAEAHCNLGHLLREQGKFDEALPSLQRGHELGAKQDSWKYPSADWVAGCQRLIATDKQLTATLAGKSKPADAAGWLALAELCQDYRHLYVAAARFYTEAFSADPSLAEAPQRGHRYNAACAAALAVAGRGGDAAKLDDAEKARLRKQALAWLRADLTLRGKQLSGGKPADRAAAQRALNHWLADSDLDGLRSDKALAALPESERKEWQKLWSEVRDQLAAVKKD